MDSLIQLYYILANIYFGLCTYLVYDFLFYTQKKLLIIKSIIFYSLIAYLYIILSEKLLIEHNSILIGFYIIGYFLGRKLLKKNIMELSDNFYSLIKAIFKFIKPIIITAFYPPIFKFLINHIKNKRIERKKRFYRYELF